MWPLDPMLRFAAKNGLTTLAEIFLYFGADVNSKTYFDRSRDSVLMLAVKSKNKEMLD
ncbi:MAG: hypothetical protein KA998_00455 [Rickettsiaceae bacterium]|nr:hypothetical protein [Rickettsiaceae bacterium]